MTKHLFLLLVLSACELGWAQPMQSMPSQLRPSISIGYQLGVFGQFTPNGFQIQSVGPGSPATRLRDFYGQVHPLSPGDVILAINDQAVRSPAAYYGLLNANANRIAKLDVRDAGTGVHYVTTGVPGLGPLRIGPQRPNAPGPRIVDGPANRVLLVGLTEDPTIGPMVAVSMKRLADEFARVPNTHVSFVAGREIDPLRVISAIDRMNVGRNDAFLCFYVGHGAYDPALATTDLASGHHFQLAGGTLLRSSVFQRMSAKNARLTVLISDSCNVVAPVDYTNRIPVERRQEERVTVNPSVIPALLANYRGVIDINGAARDQYCWFSLPHGGWFTDAFLTTSRSNGARIDNWNSFAQHLNANTQRTFAKNKSQVLRVPAWDASSQNAKNLLSKQTNQSPTTFLMRVSRF